MKAIIYRTYEDCLVLFKDQPFVGLTGFTKKLADNIVETYKFDYWLWDEVEEAGLDKSKATWQRKISKMDGWLKSKGMELESLMSALETDDTVKQIAQTKFNATPDTVGDYTTDEHTSTISTSTNSGKLGTIEKVNLSSYNRLFDKLKNEFVKTFIIQEGSLEDE